MISATSVWNSDPQIRSNLFTPSHSLLVQLLTLPSLIEDFPIMEMPYDPNIYHAVTLSLHEACEKSSKCNAQEAVFTTIRDCFLLHNVESTFSACLIHRHFDLTDSERNVEVDGKATASADLNGIYSSSWMYSNGKLYPYEFKRSPVATPPAAFVEEYGEILQACGLSGLIGFQAYTDGVIGVESTDLEARVSTTIEQSEHEPVEDGMAAASWAFFR